jgi:hypothetical protein
MMDPKKIVLLSLPLVFVWLIIALIVIFPSWIATIEIRNLLQGLFDTIKSSIHLINGEQTYKELFSQGLFGLIYLAIIDYIISSFLSEKSGRQHLWALICFVLYFILIFRFYSAPNKYCLSIVLIFILIIKFLSLNTFNKVVDIQPPTQ